MLDQAFQISSSTSRRRNTRRDNINTNIGVYNNYFCCNRCNKSTIVLYFIVVTIITCYLFLFYHFKRVTSTSYNDKKQYIDQYFSIKNGIQKQEEYQNQRTQTTVSTNRNKKNINSNDDTISREKQLEQRKTLLSLPRVLAIVFPQFHQDALNDKLWGDGFTDWDSLRNAPLKNRLGYEIPRPTNYLGYYNYTETEPRHKQGELAKQYGIDGFIYHHYWFYDTSHPGPNLHTPLIRMLYDNEPNIPFCLHWCAAHWSVTWIATNLQINTTDGLLQKQYFPQDPNIHNEGIIEHYKWLRQFFHHPNYIKVQGQPVFMIYRKKRSSFEVLRTLRELAKNDGFPGLYITMGMTASHDDLFIPGRKLGTIRFRYPKDIMNRTVAYPNPLEWMEKQVLSVPDWCVKGKKQEQLHTQIVGILTSFDNTPRRGLTEANLWGSSDPPDIIVKRFYLSIRAALFYETCCFVTTRRNRNNNNSNGDGRFILINSMNEWAEGMALEPSTVYGHRFLEVVHMAKNEVLASSCNTSILSEVTKYINK